MKTLISAQATATYLGVSDQTLANWRWRGKGPRFYHVGQLVKYTTEDLDAWLDDHASGGTTAVASKSRCSDRI